METLLDALKVSVLLTVWLVMISAISFPTEFGRWLQLIDNGRFEFVDCDCTDEIAD